MRYGLRRVMISLVLAAALGLNLAISIGFVRPVPAQAVNSAAVDPADLNVGSARQLIIVTAPNWRSRTGQVTAFERDADGGWQEVLGPTPAMLGYSGLAPSSERRQGTGKTPTGTFRIVSTFGRKPNPGTSMPYRQVDRNDAWTYDPRVPSTYNMMQTVRRSWKAYGGYVEHLWSYGVQYDYVAVLDYNLPRGEIRRGADGVRRTEQPADTSKGGGIFLHASNGTVTAGCIAIPVQQMRDITAWLDPAKEPVIVIGLD